ncbi:hypothetical protein [Arthrobacter sp. NPDC056727]
MSRMRSYRPASAKSSRIYISGLQDTERLLNASGALDSLVAHGVKRR